MLATVKRFPYEHDPFTNHIYGAYNKDERTMQRSLKYFLSARARRLNMDESQLLHEWCRKYETNPRGTLEELETLRFKEQSIMAWINSQHEATYDQDDSNEMASETHVELAESPVVPSLLPRARSLSPIPHFVEDHEGYALHLRANRLRHIYQQASDLCASVRRELFFNDATRIHAVENACYTIQDDCRHRLKECYLLCLELKHGVQPNNKRAIYPSPLPETSRPRNIGGNNTRFFTASLGSYRKDDLREIASAFGLDQYGTKNALLVRIRTHMADHPELAGDERFGGLFGRRKRLASTRHP